MVEKFDNFNKVFFDKATGRFIVKDDLAAGDVIGLQFEQETPANVWTIRHAFNTRITLPFFYEKIGDNFKRVIPDTVHVFLDKIEATFSVEIAGIANVLISANFNEIVLLTPTPTVTPSAGTTPTPTITPTFTPTPSVSPTTTATPSPTPTNTVTPTVTPTVTATVTPTPTITPTPTVTPSPSTPQAVSTGYTTGGGSTAIIESFPFGSPFTTSTQIGNLTTETVSHAAQNSGTNAYASGGTPSSPSARSSKIETFPFSTPFSTSTNVGDLTEPKIKIAGVSSTSNGYVAGGDSDTDTNLRRIENFTFSNFSFGTASVTGNLASGSDDVAGASGPGNGYIHLGRYTFGFTEVEIFPFSSAFTTATIIGSLSTDNRQSMKANASETDGFITGGNGIPTTISTIDQYPFSSPFTSATAIGNLTARTEGHASHNSETDAYTSGGSTNTPSNLSYSKVERFPFSLPFGGSTEVGDLTSTRDNHAGNEG